MKTSSRPLYETARPGSVCMKWPFVVPALCVMLSPVCAAAEEATFLGANAEIHYVRQGAKGKDGAYHQYVVYGKGDDGAWGENGPSMSLSYEDAPIIGRPGFAGIYLESSGGQGGRGGGGTSGFYSIGGNGGWGGLGGTVTIQNKSLITTTGSNAFAIYGSSIGGNGGNGGEGHGAYGKGGDGGLGESGGTVTITNRLLKQEWKLETSGTSAHGIFGQSIGGYGGAGGAGGGIYGQGGFGRGAGNGGTVSVENWNWIVTDGNSAKGIFAQSIGGFAGSGGSGSGIWGYGAGAYSGGNGGTVTVNNASSSARISTSGQDAHGIFAQSVGGGGGNAGRGAGIVSLGGNGSAGGYGGPVSVQNEAYLSLTGKNSYGIFAQSIGGGGGNADSSVGLFSIGGSGGGGGRADSVSVTNLSGIRAASHAIFAQSTGGGGGAGSNSVGWVAIGGSGALGGDGGTVRVDNSGALQTSEANAAAVFAQSVGGGGGKGGGAVSAGWWNSVALGGSGGAGGAGNAVTIINTAIYPPSEGITTKGFNSDGIFAQSVGGGGGAGGYSVAGSTGDLFASSVALGGRAGSGGRGDSVKVQSNLSIATQGDQSRGIVAQSVGGGGGSGGFSVAGSVGGGFSSAMSLGGSGGGGGTGGTVEVTTKDRHSISTSGLYSQGIFAQSVGGGGGNAGFSIAATAGSVGASVSLGGSGGSGGSSSKVTISSSSNVATTGVGSDGIFAQSVGGGGGSGGYSVAGTLAMAGGGAVSLGGRGGSGGSGGQVDVRSSGTIKTTGGNAKGVVAQSIGGGGGKGGFSVSGTISGLASASVSLGGSGGVGGTGGAVRLTASGKSIETSGSHAAALFSQSIGGGGGEGSFSASGSIAAGAPDLPSFAAAVSLGGSGATGGSGSAVNLDSSVESISTSGTYSSAIFAQSIGGGGGSGGFSGALAFSKNVSLGFSLGGSGGTGNSGGDVAVVSRSSILTWGDYSYGISAQSVGGGGGSGGFSVGGQISYDQSSLSLGATLGGNGGSGGKGGAVTLRASGSSVVTAGSNAAALFAQSTGGGGGAGGFSASLTATPTSTIPFSNLSASLGGKGAVGGIGGDVSLESSLTTVKTTGFASGGMVAQSTGGGGGTGGFSGNLAFGKKSALSFSMGGDGGSGNTGGTVSIASSSSISTSGGYSKGIFGQSVGGGGGAGGFSVTADISTTDFGGLATGLSIGGNGGIGGNAGRVTITSNGSQIATKGEYSSGIAAQSVGGGGGDGALSVSVTASRGYSFSFADVPFLNLGSKGGAAGKGGEVVVQNSSNIATQGKSSSGIFAQSIGGGGGAGGTGITVAASFTNPREFSLNAGAQGVSGAAGGDAAGVTVRDLQAEGAAAKNISTAGSFSPGLYAESTGGGGGKAGWSFEAGLSTENNPLLPSWKVTIGASGGAGGKGGAVDLVTASTISTTGEQSGGVVATSTGGGGGQGGLAVAVATKIQPAKTKLAALSVAVGGSGGIGNKADNVAVAATGNSITTKGNNSPGITARSTGGGGGDAGGSISISIDGTGGSTGGSLAFSMGGTGGTGGEGGTVHVASESSIATGLLQDGTFVSGNDAPGITASSIGGGGGSGGFSIAGMFHAGSGEKNGGAAISIGGSGGSGNKAGEVTVQSIGSFIQTLGDRSSGITAASTGGGGGSGGYSISGGASLSSQKINGDIAFSMGGKGGTGGDAGNVNVMNTSSILTGMPDAAGVHGHLSPAISASSIGGGGGSGGFSIAGSVAMSAALTPSIGGSGGAGGNGGSVSVRNAGETLATTGYHSPGITATSIGGGGGSGGFSIAGSLAVANLGVSIGGKGGSGGSGGEINVTSSSSKIATTGADSPGMLTQSIGGGGGHGGFSVDSFIGAGGIGLSIGGSGGKGGAGGSIAIHDTGQEITTSGKRAPGILAQSIGGGGGHGGIGIAAPLAPIPIPIMIGGSDAASGSGGSVSIATSSSITTKDTGSQGILAQSIGAGGGSGSINTSSDNKSGTVTLGAKELSKGDGGTVGIHTTGAAITTSGVNAAGILAQSIGAGGGIGSVEAATTVSGSALVRLGADNSSGNGGRVTVFNESNVSVKGAASHGIIAQSIGGGGGLLYTRYLEAYDYNQPKLGGTNKTSGNGSEVSVANAGTISLASGSYGIIAQSIGGGGGLVNTTRAQSVTHGYFVTTDGTASGNGGNVTVVNDGFIYGGPFSTGIFAQSVGGGGGLKQGLAGHNNGSGTSGDVTVVQNGLIQITGDRSTGIFAQSDSTGTKGQISIALNDDLTITGNSSYGIMVHGGPAVINVNSGATLTVRSREGASQNDQSIPFYLWSSQTAITNKGVITTNGPLLYADMFAGLSFANYGTVTAPQITLPSRGVFEQYGGTVDISEGYLRINGRRDISSTPTLYSMLDGKLLAKNIFIGTEPSDYVATHGQFRQSGGSVWVDNLTVNANGLYFQENGSFLASKVIVNSGGKFIKRDRLTSGDSSTADSTTVDSLQILGGYLESSGTIAAQVLNGGQVNPGNSVGTLTIDGSYTKLHNGMLITEIASATAYDRLNVTGNPGTIDLSPQDDILKPVLLPGSYRPKSGRLFASVVSAEGGISGIFNTVQGGATLVWDAVYHPASVDLVLKARDYTSPAIGLSANQQALGSLFNSVSDTAEDDLAWVLNNIDYLESPAAVRDAYQQITPEKAAAMSALSISNGLFQARAQAKRLIDQRITGNGSPVTSGIRSGASNSYLKLASAADDLSGLLVQNRSAQSSPWGVYLYPTVNWGDESSTTNRTGYRFTTTGVTTGIDRRVQDTLVLGVTSGYTYTDANFSSAGGHLKAHTIPVALYGLYLDNSWYAYGSLGYALNRYDLERKIVFSGIDRTAASNTTGHQLNLYGESGYDLQRNNITVTPMLSVGYSGLWIDGYREQGAGVLDLDTAAQQAHSLQSGFGARVSAVFRRDRYTIVPQLSAAWQHEFANSPRNISGALGQTGSFTYRTDEPQRDFVTLGARFSLMHGNDLQFELGYTTDLGRGAASSHALSAGMRWQF